MHSVLTTIHDIDICLILGFKTPSYNVIYIKERNTTHPCVGEFEELYSLQTSLIPSYRKN